MKRSRTCQCLVDLDDTPKRTRSTPDLGALRRLGALQQRQTSRDVFGGRQNFDLDSALQLLHQAVAIPEEAAAAAAAAAVSTACTAPGGPVFSAGSGLMADSIVRSKGSLNEMTILEHEQFIGQESGDYASSSVIEQQFGMDSGVALPFGRVAPGSLFDEESGDPSDYFCGVASSDEAEDDDTRTVGLGLGLGITKAMTNRRNASALFVSPTTSDSDSIGQLSDSGSSGGASCDSVYAAPSGDAAMGGTGPLQDSRSLAWAKALDEDRFGYACASSPEQLQGNAWRSNAAPRVSVTVRSPSTSASVLVSAGTEGDGSHRQPQRDTVSPPWPAGSPSSSWAYDTASRDAGSLVVSSVEESYVLMDIGRLRLAETKPPVVEVASDPLWGCWGPPSIDGAGEEVDPALKRHPALA